MSSGQSLSVGLCCLKSLQFADSTRSLIAVKQVKCPLRQIAGLLSDADNVLRPISEAGVRRVAGSCGTAVVARV